MYVSRILVTLLLFVSIHALAQQSSYISISAGTSMPLGKYANNNIDIANFVNGLATFTGTGDPSDPNMPPSNNPFGLGGGPPTSEISPFGNYGYAKTGYQITADGSYYFSKFIGVAASFCYGKNSFDNTPVTNLLALLPPDSSIGASMDFNGDPYRYYTIMVGPAFGITQGKISLDLRLMAGMASTTYAVKKFGIQVNDDLGQGMPQNFNLTMDAKESSALALSIGGNIRYSLTKNFALIMRQEIMWWQPTFKETFALEIPNFLSLPLTTPSDNKIGFSVFNFGLGLAYQFNN